MQSKPRGEHCSAVIEPGEARMKGCERRLLKLRERVEEIPQPSPCSLCSFTCHSPVSAMVQMAVAVAVAVAASGWW